MATTPQARFRGTGAAPEDPNDTIGYIADRSLAKAVNIAIELGRPLLVKGPPGSGKTRLAEAVKHELGLPLHRWYVKSTSRARDGLYTIDVVRRLQDAQRQDRRAQRLTPYIRFGPLGEALRSNRESVVLIDEIDKADIDFPNDLLRELDERKFTIEELNEADLTRKERAAGWRRTYGEAAPGEPPPRPIVIITSNDEKELPDAFLRRCVFHYIKFPDPEALLDIVRVNLPHFDLEESLVRRAITTLDRFREIEGVRKRPETSELIDWVRILHTWGADLSPLDEQPPLGDLPHWEVLYKHQRDAQVIRNARGAAPA